MIATSQLLWNLKMVRFHLFFKFKSKQNLSQGGLAMILLRSQEVVLYTMQFDASLGISRRSAKHTMFVPSKTKTKSYTLIARV